MIWYLDGSFWNQSVMNLKGGLYPEIPLMDEVQSQSSLLTDLSIWQKLQHVQQNMQRQSKASSPVSFPPAPAFLLKLERAHVAVQQGQHQAGKQWLTIEHSSPNEWENNLAKEQIPQQYQQMQHLIPSAGLQGDPQHGSHLQIS